MKRLEFSCRSGQVIWHAPNGGLFIEIKGPAKEHQLCIQTESLHTSAMVSRVEETGALKRLITIEEAKQKRQKKHTMCFSAHGSTLLFAEPDIGAFVSSKIVIDYDVEANPKYGEDGKSLVISKTQNTEGILPVATLSIALYVSCRSRPDSNIAPEVTKLSSSL